MSFRMFVRSMRGRSVMYAGASGAAALLLASSVVVAQDGLPRALIKELDPYPGGGAGEFVSSLSSIWVNGVGGFGVTLNNEDAGGALLNFHTIWGQNNTGDAPPHRLFEEGASDGGYTVTAIQTDAKIDNNGDVWYSGTVTGGTGTDSVWKNNSLLFAADDPIPSLPGQFFSFASGIGLAADGSKMYFIGGITNTAGGSSQNRGLFDQAGNVLWKGGDILPGYAEPISMTATPGFQIEVSANASYVMDKVSLVGGVGAQAMVVNGTALTDLGTALREGNPVPAATPGTVAGESWDNFDDWDVNESGKFIVNGDTDSDTTKDEFLYSNHGGFLLREGQTIARWDNPVETYTVGTTISDSDMNEDGDWVVEWNVAGGDEALFMNGVLISKEGDAVDFDNDGIIDPGALIVSYTGLDGDLRIADRDVDGIIRVYATADIDINGTPSTLDDVEAFLCFEFSTNVPAPGALALLGLAGVCGRRRRRM